jgi:hypothetical protein
MTFRLPTSYPCESFRGRFARRADYPPSTHFVEPPLRLLLEGDGWRCDFHERFRGVNLHLAYVVSEVSFRNRLRNIPKRDYNTQTLMLTGLILPITAIFRT